MHRLLGRRARKLLALFLMGTAFAVALAQPASAYTISKSDTQIVITSERLTAITVHATGIFTLRSDGQVSFHGDVHNSGSTRKFYKLTGSVDSPNSGIKEFYSSGCIRIGGDSYDTLNKTWVDPLLAPNWVPVHNDGALKASFNLTAVRLGAC